jgi:hypothetical protein
MRRKPTITSSRKPISVRDKAAGAGSPKSPAEDPDYVSLAEAIEFAGTVIHGAKWPTVEDTRYNAAPIPAFDEVIDEREAERVASTLILAMSQLVPPDGGELTSEWAETPEAWSAAAAIIEEERISSRAAASLRQSVQGRILTAFRSGQIATFQGRDRAPLAATFWHRSDWQDVFTTGSVTVARKSDWGPMTAGASDAIAVSRQNLAAAFPTGSPISPLADGWDHLSPVLRLAIDAAHRIIETGVEPLAKALAADLMKTASDRNIKLDKTLAARMATIIRSAEAANGGRKKIEKR